MKIFAKIACQGDLMLIRVAKMPDGVKQEPAVKGEYVLTHSESGHDHVVLERPEVSLYSFEELKGYLMVGGEEPVELLHKRSHDTHETILINPGMYELRRQREHSPEGWRRAAD